MYAGGKIREMQVFLEADNDAWRKKSFHLCNYGSRSWGLVVSVGNHNVNTTPL